jgi:hypothetical protein
MHSVGVPIAGFADEDSYAEKHSTDRTHLPPRFACMIMMMMMMIRQTYASKKAATAEMFSLL